ncbi:MULTISPECIES: acyltransferase [Vibrio]|uniref:acyltransferase n=1 Tax=Vibrio TaxID=662 RepID=UPI00069614C1|nr:MULTISPECIES: acyltransferase [Vibrio]
MKSKLLRVALEELWSFYQWIFLFIPGRIGHYIRGYSLKIFFKSSGKKITIKENVEIYRPQNIIIGDNSGFGRNNIIDATGGINIGTNVRLGPNVMIATLNHAKSGGSIKDNRKESAQVSIGSNVWIGHGVTILPGVIVGNDVIIAAGAVVTKNIPSQCTVAGVPAKIIKSSLQ